ncbi:putative membrane protein [Anoxybacillus tepidamans]|uniref:Putative membrane protein n=1 Tax=Anoxybacteroides tepidamans TaxID=265948 RepID=A0A7W8IMQ0_9BACL|nr:putative membrane protein [Anoxybacillus tepidamans]
MRSYEIYGIFVVILIFYWLLERSIVESHEIYGIYNVILIFYWLFAIVKEKNVVYVYGIIPTLLWLVLFYTSLFSFIPFHIRVVILIIALVLLFVLFVIKIRFDIKEIKAELRNKRDT